MPLTLSFSTQNIFLHVGQYISIEFEVVDPFGTGTSSGFVAHIGHFTGSESFIEVAYV